MSDKFIKQERERLIQEQLAPYIQDKRVIDAFRKVDREKFMEPGYEGDAYINRAFPISAGQTISQPFVVAKMLELVALKPSMSVLEVGTGSGYQTALLAELSKNIYTVERNEDLYRNAQQRLAALGYTNIQFKLGNGWEGWKEKAPFNAIIVSAAAPEVPRELVRQLARGGKMIVPVGQEDQELVLIEKGAEGLTAVQHGEVRFVPLIDQPK